MRKIVVVSTEGSSREDGSVYYSTFLIVSSETLKFDEPIFTASLLDGKQLLALGLIDQEQYEDDDTSEATGKVAAHIENLGYTVEEPETAYVTVDVG